LELCGPGEGGLTPSNELLQGVLESVNIPTHVMIRPRAGDFNYTSDEFNQMLDSVAFVKSQCATGVVFGILKEDLTLDVERMHILIKASRPMKVVCHKAFDETPDAENTLDQLIELGVDEVLTSGHKRTALEGAQDLKGYLERSNGRIKIMAGGTVRAENIKALV
jgi:copper homeostasis protein